MVLEDIEAEERSSVSTADSCDRQGDFDDDRKDREDSDDSGDGLRRDRRRANLGISPPVKLEISVEEEVLMTVVVNGGEVRSWNNHLTDTKSEEEEDDRLVDDDSAASEVYEDAEDEPDYREPPPYSEIVHDPYDFYRESTLTTIEEEEEFTESETEAETTREIESDTEKSELEQFEILEQLCSSSSDDFDAEEFCKVTTKKPERIQSFREYLKYKDAVGPKGEYVNQLMLVNETDHVTKVKPIDVPPEPKKALRGILKKKNRDSGFYDDEDSKKSSKNTMSFDEWTRAMDAEIEQLVDARNEYVSANSSESIFQSHNKDWENLHDTSENIGVSFEWLDSKSPSKDRKRRVSFESLDKESDRKERNRRVSFESDVIQPSINGEKEDNKRRDSSESEEEFSGRLKVTPFETFLKEAGYDLESLEDKGSKTARKLSFEFEQLTKESESDQKIFDELDFEELIRNEMSEDSYDSDIWKVNASRSPFSSPQDSSNDSKRRKSRNVRHGKLDDEGTEKPVGQNMDVRWDIKNAKGQPTEVYEAEDGRKSKASVRVDSWKSSDDLSQEFPSYSQVGHDLDNDAGHQLTSRTRSNDETSTPIKINSSESNRRDEFSGENKTSEHRKSNLKSSPAKSTELSEKSTDLVCYKELTSRDKNNCDEGDCNVENVHEDLCTKPEDDKVNNGRRSKKSQSEEIVDNRPKHRRVPSIVPADIVRSATNNHRDTLKKDSNDTLSRLSERSKSKRKSPESDVYNFTQEISNSRTKRNSSKDKQVKEPSKSSADDEDYSERNLWVSDSISTEFKSRSSLNDLEPHKTGDERHERISGHNDCTQEYCLPNPIEDNSINCSQSSISSWMSGEDLRDINRSKGTIANANDTFEIRRREISKYNRQAIDASNEPIHKSSSIKQENQRNSLNNSFIDDVKERQTKRCLQTADVPNNRTQNVEGKYKLLGAEREMSYSRNNEKDSFEDSENEIPSSRRLELEDTKAYTQKGMVRKEDGHSRRRSDSDRRSKNRPDVSQATNSQRLNRSSSLANGDGNADSSLRLEVEDTKAHSRKGISTQDDGYSKRRADDSTVIKKDINNGKAKNESERPILDDSGTTRGTNTTNSKVNNSVSSEEIRPT